VKVISSIPPELGLDFSKVTHLKQQHIKSQSLTYAPSVNMSDQKHHQDEEDLSLTEAELGKMAASAQRLSGFSEYFAPPPNYPGQDSYEMNSFSPQATGAGRDQAAPGAPTTAQEETFNFQYFAPKRNPKRYFIALVTILILIIASLAALAGILSHKLNTMSKPQNVTITMTERFSTTATDIQLTTLSMTLTSVILLTTTEQLTFTMTLKPTHTHTDLPVGKPTPAPTIDTAPHATCIAVDHTGGGADIRIWANYISSMPQVISLAVALDRRCAVQVDATGWTISPNDQTWPEPNGDEWMSDNAFEFVFAKVALPQGLQCIQQALVDAGGPSDTPNCTYQPVSGTAL
jgi:hypothetical protein